MKTVLISIQPKWCELIAIKKKSLEVRKNRPKLETPFRCYIYETRKKWWYKLLAPLKSFAWVETVISGQGKVIGEFICDTIVPISVKYSDINSHLALREFPLTCLTDKQIIDYLGNGVTGYGWHISNLKIYEKPLDISNFFHACDKPSDQNCYVCEESGKARCKQLIRAPQSWCYVMELQ